MKCNVVIGSLLLLFSPLFSFRAALSHSYHAKLQREQASMAIAILMCEKDNGAISQNEYDQKLENLRFSHITEDGDLDAVHTHLVPRRNKGPEVIAVAKEMKNNLGKDCSVINNYIHEMLLKEARAICTLRKELCVERELYLGTLGNIINNFQNNLYPLAITSESKDVGQPEREAALEKFCLLAGQQVRLLKEKVDIWTELGMLSEGVPQEQDQNIWWEKFDKIRKDYCL